jgi:hypothetical protein
MFVRTRRICSSWAYLASPSEHPTARHRSFEDVHQGPIVREENRASVRTAPMVQW